MSVNIASISNRLNEGMAEQTIAGSTEDAFGGIMPSDSIRMQPAKQVMMRILKLFTYSQVSHANPAVSQSQRRRPAA